MVMAALIPLLPYLAGATAAGAAGIVTWQQREALQQFAQQASQWIGEVGDTIREWMGITRQQAEQVSTLAFEAEERAARAQAVSEWQAYSERILQQKLAQDQAQVQKQAAVATAAAAAIPTAVNPTELWNQVHLSATMAGMSDVDARLAADQAVTAYVAAKAPAQVISEIDETVATTTVTEVADISGKTIDIPGVTDIPGVIPKPTPVVVDTPGLGTSAMTVPLTGAALATLTGTLAQSFARAGHRQTVACMGTTGGAMLGNIMQAAIPTALAAGFMISPEIQEGFTGLAAKALDILYRPLERQAPITPEKAPGIGVHLLMQAVLLGSGAHLLSVTAEAAAPLKHMGLGYLSAFMADMAGFSKIAAAYQGMMIQWGLQQPMRYWALDKFRPMLPDPRLLMEMSLKREISDDQFDQGMGHAGYSPEWIETFHRYKWRDPRLFEVLWIADVTRPPPTPPPEAIEWLTRAGMEEWIGPDWWYAIKFAKGGYDPIDLPVLAKVTKRRTIATARTRRLFSTRQLYREGYVDPDFIYDQFRLLDEPAESADHWVEAEKLERQYHLLQDQKGIYLDQFAKDVIDQDDLRVALSTMIVDPEFLEAELEHAVLKKYKPVAKAVAAEEKALRRKVQAQYVQGYTDLFRKDHIDQDQYYEYLVTLEIEPELAIATVHREEARKLPKVVTGVPAEVERVRKQVQAKRVKAVTDLFRKDYITPEEFREELELAFVAPELAMATVQAEMARKLP